jgi:hypothetical protein
VSTVEVEKQLGYETSKTVIASRVRGTDVLHGLGWVVCAAAMAGVALMSYVRPMLTFDRLLYAGAVAHLHTSDPDLIVREALRLSPSGDYPHTAFGDEILHRPILIAYQVPLYSSRLVYLYALDFLGMRTVSPVAYLGIGIVLLCWLRNPWWCLALVLAPDMIYLSRSITPDALSVLLVMVGLFLVAFKREGPGLLLLFISLAVRTDNLLYLAAVVLVLGLRRRMSWYAALAVFVAGMVAVFGIQHYTHDLGGGGWTWRMRSLIENNIAMSMFLEPGSVPMPRVTPREYVTALSHGVIGMTTVGFSLWALLGAVEWIRDPKSRDWVFVAGFYAVAHILIFPMPEARYYVASFLLVWIAFAQAMIGKSEATVGGIKPLQKLNTASRATASLPA